MIKRAALTTSGRSVQGFALRIQCKRHYQIELGLLKSPLACPYLHGSERSCGQLRFDFLAKCSPQSSEDLRGGRNCLFGFDYGKPLSPGPGKKGSKDWCVCNWNLFGKSACVVQSISKATYSVQVQPLSIEFHLCKSSYLLADRFAKENTHIYASYTSF